MTTKPELTAIPSDFPILAQLGAVSGVVPKLLLSRDGDGKYVAPQISAEERVERWQMCEDLASQFSSAALKSKFGKRSDWHEADILEQYLPRLEKMGWATKDESIWILRRVGAILKWPLPKCLQLVGDISR